MKKKIYVLLGLVFALLFAGITVTSCNYEVRKKSEIPVDETPQPTGFENLKAVIDYQQWLVESYTIDSVFRAMPVQVLTNVTQVLLNRQGPGFDIDEIVDEYRSHIDIYNNLESPVALESSNNTNNENAVMEGQRATESDTNDTIKVGRVYYNFKDTVVNGKKARIITKTETTYVE